MYVLGISAFYHDSAAALVHDGVVVSAAQEERFTRIRHDPAFPANAIASCLACKGIELDDVDLVVFYEKPFLKFERLLETYLAIAPKGFRSFRIAMPLWLKDKLMQKRSLARQLRVLGATFGEERIHFAEHHQSHAASAFFPSPFEEAAVLTIDGVGEWATTVAGHGRANTLELSREILFPHSLGLLYSAFTYYLGFRVNSGEYKVMGLAPYGEPRFAPLILDHLIDLKQDGSFRLDLSYFDYLGGDRMTSERFHDLFGGPPLPLDTPPTHREMDIAASIQDVTEEVVLRLTRALADETGSQNLCLAGGVALNCVANGHVLRDGRFREIWVQPASGDAGGAVGAALAAYHELCAGPRTPIRPDGMSGALLGPAFSDDEVEARLRGAGAVLERLDRADMLERTAQALADGEVVGLVPGSDGVRSTGARGPVDPGRSPLPGDAVEAQPQGQAARVLSAVRPVRDARVGGGVVRPRRRQPLHAARRRGPIGPSSPDHAGAGSAHRDRPPAGPAFGDPGRDPCRSLRSHPDGGSGDRSPLPRPSLRVRADHRLPRARQHQLQRARRADRLHAGGCPALLPDDLARPTGGGRVHALQGVAAPGARSLLPGGWRARLSEEPDEAVGDGTGAAPGAGRRTLRITWVVFTNVVILIALLLFTNLLSAIVMSNQETVRRVLRVVGAERLPPLSTYVDLPVYADKDEARLIWKEFAEADEVGYVPFLEWRRKPYTGQTITIGADGDRIWPGAPKHPSDAPVVRMFGGSSLWGTGVTDAQTIPAALQDLRPALRVLNHGESEHNSRQGLERVVNVLSRDQPVDVAVLYEGFNDVLTLCRDDVDLNGHGEQVRMRAVLDRAGTPGYLLLGKTMELMANVFASSETAFTCDTDPARARAVARVVVNQWQLARTLLQARGAETLAVLQPVAEIGTPELGYFDDVETPGEPSNGSLARQLRAVYPHIQSLARRPGNEWIHDFSALFDDAGPTYLDHVHLSAEGNALVARRLAPLVDAALARRGATAR